MPKQQKMPADPNRRAKATMDIVDAILNGEAPAKDPGRVERGKLGGSNSHLDVRRNRGAARLAAKARL